MAEEPWYVFALAALPGAGTMLAGILVSRNERRKQAHERENQQETLDEARQRRIDEDFESLNKTLRSDLVDVRQQLADARTMERELRRQLNEVQKQADKNREAARVLNNAAHEVRHSYSNRLFIANGRLTTAGLPSVDKPPIEIPDIEDLV